MLIPLLVGFAFGYIGSMPVAGPISVLVLDLGMERDPRHGLYVAAGGAVAESLYALLAFWGLSSILARHPVILPASRVVGSGLLLALGVAMLLFRSAAPKYRRGRGDKRSFALGLLITAVNPTLIVTWTAAVGALHATGLVAMHRAEALPFAAAACAGIIAWFATLLWLVGKWRERVSQESLATLKRAMGAVLIAVGGWMGLRALLGALPR